MKRRAPSLLGKITWTLAAFFLSEIVPAHAAQEPALDCASVFEDSVRLAELGPHSQTMIAKPIETEDGTHWIFGTETSVQRTDQRTIAAHEVLKNLSGESERDLSVGRAITGSLTRITAMERASDLDFETLLVLRLKSGGFEVLNDATSPEMIELARYFQRHIDQVLAENPSYRFIELKAGEFSNESGELKGIKWSLEDIHRGYKTVTEPSGTRVVSLSAALAEDARIKSDWAVPAVNQTPIENSYTEASVLYRLGGQIGNNQVRMRLSSRNDGTTLAVRATTVAMDKDDFELLRDASVATKSTSIEEVHHAVMESLKKYSELDDPKSGHRDEIKILKRIYSLLQFWEQVPDYNTLRGASTSRESLLNSFQVILNDPTILDLGQLKAKTELLIILKDKGIDLPKGVKENWLNQLQLRYGVKKTKLEAIESELKSRINRRYRELIKRFPDVADYTDWVLSRIPYSEGMLSQNPYFLVLKPQKDFVKSVTDQLKIWRKKYPHLSFVHPKDLHMTVRFVGRMTPSAANALNQQTHGNGEGTPFSGGGVHIFGRRFQVLAMLYDPNPGSLDTIRNARARASALGAVPDKTSQSDFVPHISIAQVDLSSPQSRAEAEQFVREEHTDDLAHITMHGMELWTHRNEGTPRQPRYAPF